MKDFIFKEGDKVEHVITGEVFELKLREGHEGLNNIFMASSHEIRCFDKYGNHKVTDKYPSIRLIERPNITKEVEANVKAIYADLVNRTITFRVEDKDVFLKMFNVFRDNGYKEKLRFNYVEKGFKNEK